MKLAMNIGSLAVVGLFSVTTLAQVAVRPRPAEGVRPEIAVKPGAATKGMGLEKQYQQTRAATRQQADSCSTQQFASDLAAGTRVSYADAKAVVDANLVSNGTCADGVTKYKVPARENLLEAEVCTLNNGGAKVSLAERNSNIRPNCYKAAFDNDPGATPTTLASAKATVEQLYANCHLIK